MLWPPVSAQHRCLDPLQTDFCLGCSCVDSIRVAADRSPGGGNAKTECQCCWKIPSQVPPVRIWEGSGSRRRDWFKEFSAYAVTPTTAHVCMWGGFTVISCLFKLCTQKKPTAPSNTITMQTHTDISLNVSHFKKTYKSVLLTTLLYSSSLFTGLPGSNWRGKNIYL